jgi:hypothetical protein
MSRKQFVESASRGLLYGAAVAAGVYAHMRGRPGSVTGMAQRVDDDQDPLLDTFMPT